MASSGIEISDIVNQAHILAYEQKIEHLNHAFNEEWSLRQKQQEEIGVSFNKVCAHLSAVSEDEQKLFKQKLIQKHEQDAKYARQINGLISSCQEGSFSLKTNKLLHTFKQKEVGIIRGSQEFIEHYFETIAGGVVPEGYAFNTLQEDITYLGHNPRTLHGSSKGTYAMNAFTLMNVICTEQDHMEDEVNLDISAKFHLTAFPKSLQDQLKALKDFSYLCHYDARTLGLSFAHSGYVYGGHRSEANRYVGRHKYYGPEDCSSWVSRITGCPYSYATVHQTYLYENTWPPNSELSLKEKMESLYEPMPLRDPQRDILPGSIYCVKGHTALILGFHSDGPKSEIVGMAYSRDMPHVEGFGIQTFPVEMQNKKTMLFKVRT